MIQASLFFSEFYHEPITTKEFDHFLHHYSNCSDYIYRVFRKNFPMEKCTFSKLNTGEFGDFLYQYFIYIYIYHNILFNVIVLA